MKKKGRSRVQNPDKDLDEDVNYEVSESDDDDFDEDVIALRKSRKKGDELEEEEVLAVHVSTDDDSEDEAEEKESSELSDSDIEGFAQKTDNIPDAKAWGQIKRNFYSTDYVDQDFLGFDNLEAAVEEEKEAHLIQKRITQELEDADFDLGLLELVDQEKELMNERSKEASAVFQEKIKEVVPKDLSSFNHSQLVEILKTSSPGFLNLLDICKGHLKVLKEIIKPALDLAGSINVLDNEAIQLLKVYKYLITMFTTNTLFYLYLKSNGSKVDGHPVIQRLVELELLLKTIKKSFEAGLDKQVEVAIKESPSELCLLKPPENMGNGAQMLNPNDAPNRKERRKRKLLLLQQLEEEEKEILEKTNKIRSMTQSKNKKMDNPQRTHEAEPEENESEEMEESAEQESELMSKRPANYQILKNKGLTPRRKKEVRNPRVRNRNKYRKAVIRRRGQVRDVKYEVKKYDGEIFGINKNVSKSIKFK